MQMTLNRTIKAPRDPVWQLFTDLEKLPDAISGITRLEVLTDGPVGKGTRFRETRVMFKRETTEEMEITGWNPSDSYAVEAESCGAHFRTEYTFTDAPDGTNVDMTMVSKPLTFVAKIMGVAMAPMMKRTMRKCLESDIDELRAIAEA